MKNKHIRGTCPCCPQTEDNLSLDEVLYNGFGGYHVERNGEVYYSGDPQGEWESFKKLSDIEEEIKKNGDNQENQWKVILDNPLRGATWERNSNGDWLLTETNQGFA